MGGRMENIKKQLGLFLSSSTYLLTEECNVSTWPCIRITWGRLKDETHCYQQISFTHLKTFVCFCLKFLRHSLFLGTWVQQKREGVFVCQEKANRSIIVILSCLLFRLIFLSQQNRIQNTQHIWFCDISLLFTQLKCVIF